jgi:hypothetical protein
MLGGIFCRQGNLIQELKDGGIRVGRRVCDKIDTIGRMYEQQLEMYRNKSHNVSNRIVSLVRPHIRYIVRGKVCKDVEFGPKVSLSYVNDYCFCDFISHEAYNETTCLTQQVSAFKQRFW